MLHRPEESAAKSFSNGGCVVFPVLCLNGTSTWISASSGGNSSPDLLFTQDRHLYLVSGHIYLDKLLNATLLAAGSMVAEVSAGFLATGT